MLMPELQKLYQNLGKQGLVVLGLDVGEDADTVTQFARKQSYSFPLLLGAEPEVTARYYVESYPTTLVIDRQGRIVSRNRGVHRADELSGMVSDALRGAP